MYFCSSFISLSSQNKKKTKKKKNSTKMQEKEDQKVAFVSLSIHTNLEHEEHIQK